MSPSDPGSLSAPRGLFDFQVNGFAGVDFQSDELTPEGLAHAAAALRDHGTTAIFLTLITDSIERLRQKLVRITAWRAADPAVAKMIAGYHLEGPWLCAQNGYAGAHPAVFMQPPRWEEFQRLQAAADGLIRLVTLAPELPGSPAFIELLRGTGVQVSLGHTNASVAEIDAAVSSGARFCTHLGNGVPGVLPRHDNIIQRLLARDDLFACFIPDGIHLPPFVLRNMLRAKPVDRVLFTTDAMAGAGAGPGSFTLGTMRVEVGDDGIARQPAGTGFAGSTLTPDEGVRRIISYLGIDFAAAQRLWSEAPARAFGVTLAAPS